MKPFGLTICKPDKAFFGYDERFGRVSIVFRTYRYSPDFLGLHGKTLEPEQCAWLNHLYK